MNDLLLPYEPTPRDPFDLRKAGHLLRRAGFGGSLQLRLELVRLGVEAAVQRLSAPVPASASDALLQEAIALGNIERVRAYRVYLALQGEPALSLRMTAFWHDHFATSNQKLGDPRAMALQLDVFDRLGLGPFPELLLAVVRDPAMLRWLDNDSNVKAQPNENLARELFELFCLGRGNYSEHDIQAAARAFTGWHVRDDRFHFAAHLHDGGDKQVFGQRGAFDGDDIVRLASRRRESATFLSRKWLAAFVHSQPESAEIEALADVYEGCERDVGATLTVLLRSRLFFSKRAYRSKIKSPADWVLGLVRGLGARAAPSELAVAMGRMGELWLEPPSVAGWPGERAWINPASWLLRVNFAADLLGGRRGKLQPRQQPLLQRYTQPEDRVQAAALLLLDGDLDPDCRQRLLAFAASDAGRGPGGDAALLHAVTMLPEAQLL